MTVASSLKQLLVRARGKTVGEVAKEVGMSRPAFSNVINGNARLTIALALRIEEAHGIDADRLMRWQLDEELKEARARHSRPRPQGAALANGSHRRGGGTG